MTLHVLPRLGESAAGACAASIIPTALIDDTMPAPGEAARPDRRNVRPAESPAGDCVAMSFAHLGLVVDISAIGAAVPAADEHSSQCQTVPDRTHCSAGVFLRSPPPHGKAAGETWRSAAGSDRVVQSLSHALQTVERRGDSVSGLCADALRLAVIARILSIHHRSAQPTEPQQRASLPKLGLVKWRLRRAIAFIDEHIDEKITLADMASASGLSRMHFAAQFQVATGLRPHEYLLKRRIERAQTLMRATREPLVQIALSVGFQSQAHFTTVFRRFVGETPYRWRRVNGAPGGPPFGDVDASETPCFPERPLRKPQDQPALLPR